MAKVLRIGSTNPVKATAVEHALEGYDTVVTPVSVDFGVGLEGYMCSSSRAQPSARL